MKQMKIMVERTNVEDKFTAYSIAKSSRGVKASEYVDLPFTVEEYVETHNVITDLDSGEVKEMNCLTLITEDGQMIGTNSPTLISNFFDLVELMEDYDLEITDKQFIIRKGKGKNGTFSTIEAI